jgi:AraC family transcriptional regulator
VTPSKAKSGGQTFQAVLPMTIQVKLKGELPMDYRIEKKPAMTFRGIKKEVTTVDGQNYEILPKFWEDFFAMPVSKSILAHIGPLGVVGACYPYDEATQLFDYMIGVEASDELKGEEIDVLEIFYDGDTKSEDYRCEVWIPILEK